MDVCLLARGEDRTRRALAQHGDDLSQLGSRDVCIYISV